MRARQRLVPPSKSARLLANYCAPRRAWDGLRSVAIKMWGERQKISIRGYDVDPAAISRTRDGQTVGIDFFVRKGACVMGGMSTCKGLMWATAFLILSGGRSWAAAPDPNQVA